MNGNFLFFFVNSGKYTLTIARFYGIVVWLGSEPTEHGVQKYPRGSRGSPAKGVVPLPVARVRISSSAPCVNNTNSFSEFVLFFARDFFGAVIRLK